MRMLAHPLSATRPSPVEQPPPVPEVASDGYQIRGVWPATFPAGWRWGEHHVYALYDADGRCCYVGETGDLPRRLARHARNKAFTTWVALTISRQDRYAYEDRWTFALKPYLFNDGTVRP